LLGSLVRTQPYGVLGEVAKAAEELASKKEGALIVLERQVGLKTYVETGTRLDARASAELMVTVFTPPSPLHDGALIIRGDRVVAAGCILPLTQNPELSKSLGTRHRAALGLSEESDALVLVVSEETRQISVAFNGVLRKVKDTGALLSELSAVYGKAPVSTTEELESWLQES
jgi:diadenylate cyclase